jgi:hypothetical protein
MRPLHLTASLALVLSLAAASHAADPQGPTFGANRCRAAIARVCSEPDVDDYVASLLAGEKLTVTLAVDKRSALMPRLTLVGPDGVEFAPSALVTKRGGKSLSLRAFAAPTTGRWCVRVVGAGGSEGGYTIAFSVAAAPRSAAKNVIVDGARGATIAFQGIDGARLDVVAKWKDRRTQVVSASLAYPSGLVVGDVPATAKATSFTIKGAHLRGGDGTYTLRLAGTGVATGAAVTVRVTPQGRPRSARVMQLPDAEPYLDVLPGAVRGVPGVAVRLTGGNLPTTYAPTVLFGDVAASSYPSVDGKSIVVIPPELAGGANCSVAVLAKDGQACVRDAYFYCVPMPVVNDLVDSHGTPVRFGRATGGDAVFVRGTGFGPSQVVRFGAKDAALGTVSSTQMGVVAPAGVGLVRLSVVDEFGRVVTSAFEFGYLNAPTISSAVATGGARLDASHAAPGGGAVVTVSGANFDATDSVTLGGTACVVSASTGGTLTFTSSAAPIGPADLVVTDRAGQSATLAAALRISGWQDATAGRSPGRGDVDDLSALRGAVADFDGDGLADLVVCSDAKSPGTRAAHTRLFLSVSGTLADANAEKFPAPTTDAGGAVLDAWRADAVAVGDVAGTSAPDIVIAGQPVATDGAALREARIFANDGTGGFAFDASSPQVRNTPWNCTDAGTGLAYSLFSPDAPTGATATAIAVADLNGDGVKEIVVATDHFRTGALHLPLADVAFAGDVATTQNADANWSASGTTVDSPALRIFEKQNGEYVDVTFTRLPRGDASPGTSPAYHARDVKIADVDLDGRPDIVLTWDDPTSVTPFGLANPGADQARVATRVLINSGNGFYVDRTSTWMPNGGADEYWQADRLALADLNGDGYPDLVLVHRESVDAYTGSATYARSALRVLMNRGAIGPGFVDVTSTALPSVPLAGTKDDNLRGAAIAVLDVDGDGVLDIVVGTDAALAAGSGGAARSTRFLRGAAGAKFSDAGFFLPPTTRDTGEANDLVVGDFDGDGGRSLVFVSKSAPAKSALWQILRVFDWVK